MEEFVKLGIGGAALYIALQIVKLIFDWLKARIAPEAELDKQQTDVQKQLIESNSEVQKQMMALYAQQVARSDEMTKRQDDTQELNRQLVILGKQNTDYYKLLSETIQNTILELPAQLRSDRTAIQASVSLEGQRVIAELKAQFAVQNNELAIKIAAIEQMAQEIITTSGSIKGEMVAVVEANLSALGTKILNDIRLLKEKTDPLFVEQTTIMEEP